MADDMRTLGYICPKCGAQVMGARSVFALEASDAEIECSCGGSVLRTNYDGQNYHILVPCGVCGQTHEAVCPPERMLHAATALSCPDSKQFCCFIGDEGTVEHHLREASIAISKEKAQENSGEAEAFTDNVIMYEFLSELKDIAARPNGITCGCGSHDYSMEIRRDAVELTCRDCGARNTVKAALPHMISEKRGCIVNISSIWGQRGASCEVAYSCTKAGIIALTRSLAMELAPSGIRVNCVAPGVINTDMVQVLGQETVEELIRETPLGRLGTPEDIAYAVAFFASERAGFITGQVLTADGGFIV